MCKRIQIGWIIFVVMMASLTLTACVRPHPDSKKIALTAVPIVTQQAFITQVPPSSLVTSTPIVEPTIPLIPTIEPTAKPPSVTTYIVRAGDTLYEIAVSHDVTLEDLAEANDIINVDILEVGQNLIIPVPDNGGNVVIEETETPTATDSTEPGEVPATPAPPTDGVHVVRPGDNLFRIGLQYGCSVEQLSRHNGITNPNRISVGMEIQIPDCD